MLEGWYCRTINEEARQQSARDSTVGETNKSESMQIENDSAVPENESEGESSGNRNVDYKLLYSSLKKKVKDLIYENVYFHHNLRASQRRLLKVTRDRTFLLDRLLEYERPELTDSDSGATDSSDGSSRLESTTKRRKVELSSMASSSSTKTPAQNRRNKKELKKQPPQQNVQQHQPQQDVQQHQPQQDLQQHQPQQITPQMIEQMLFQSQSFMPHEDQSSSTLYQSPLGTIADIQQTPLELLASSYPSLSSIPQCDVTSQEEQLTKEEIERHLQSRQTVPELVPEGELPTEMFNNNPSSDLNDHLGHVLSGGLFFG